MAKALVSGATFRRFDSSPVPRRADVLETGDFGGDKLSGLPRHVGEPRRADVLSGCRVRRWLTLRCASAG